MWKFTDHEKTLQCRRRTTPAGCTVWNAWNVLVPRQPHVSALALCSCCFGRSTGTALEPDPQSPALCIRCAACARAAPRRAAVEAERTRGEENRSALPSRRRAAVQCERQPCRPARSCQAASRRGQNLRNTTNNASDGPMQHATAARPSAQFITPPAAYSCVLNVRRCGPGEAGHVRTPLPIAGAVNAAEVTCVRGPRDVQVSRPV